MRPIRDGRGPLRAPFGAPLFAALLLLSASPRLVADQLYRSDPIGIELGAVEPAEAAELEWVLSVGREGSTETRTLLHAGKENRRWVDELSRGELVKETLYREGVLASVTTFRDGLPIEELDYADGQASERRIYTYDHGHLASIRVEGGGGTLLYTTRISRGPEGRLRRAVRELADGKSFDSVFVYGGDELIAEWEGSKNRGQLLRYGPQGAEAVQNWLGDTIAEQTEVTREGAERTSVESDLATGTVTTRLYNASNELVGERVSVKGIVESRSELSYAAGRLVDKIVLTPGVREESRYSYGSDGKLQRVELTRNLRLVKVTVYTGGNTSYEELYSEGKPFVRVYYVDGNAVKSEPVEGG